MDGTTTVLERPEEDIDNLKTEVHTLHNKLEDLESRSRRSNIRVRGLPESIMDLQSTVTALCQELAADMLIE